MKLLTTIRLTQTQRQVIAKIVASQDVPARAASEISTSQNLITARNMLMKLGVITYSTDSAALTPKGENLAREQNVIDETGNLTDEGNSVLGLEQTPTDQPPAETPLETLPMEGFSDLFKSMLRL